MSFFNLGINTSTKKSSKKPAGCSYCNLKETCESPKMPIDGEGKKEIMIIGEAPGRIEDRRGIPFIGESGELLEETLEEFGIDMRKDCWITNTVSCRPPENRNASSAEIENCRSKLMKEIEEKKPKIILAVGLIALQGLIQHRITGRLKGTKPSQFFNKRIPDRKYNSWICGIFHPAYLLRNEDDQALKKIWKKGIKEALDLLDAPLYTIPENSYYTKEEDVIKHIKIVRKDHHYIAFDYETTGLKPHKKGHKIYSAAFTYKFNGVYISVAFKMTDSLKPHWKKLMLSENVRKIAHKADFEITSLVREWDCGVWDGRTAREFLEMLGNSGKPISAFEPEGGETLAEVQARAAMFIERILADFRGKTVAVCSHGDFMRMLVGCLLGLEIDQANLFYFGNASYSLFEHDGRDWKVIFINRLPSFDWELF